MLTIIIHNDGTGTNESANYDYQVKINSELIASGEIVGHNRDDGWENLVEMVLWEEFRKKGYDATPTLKKVIELAASMSTESKLPSHKEKLGTNFILNAKPVATNNLDGIVKLSEITRPDWVVYHWIEVTSFFDAERSFIRGKRRSPEEGARAAEDWDFWHPSSVLIAKKERKE
jgi:hypothetical protein